MKRSVAVETEENDTSTETESLLARTPRRMSDPEIETSTSEAGTSEDVERQIRAVTDPLTQQLAHLCELMKELWDAHAHRRHEETTSSIATSSSTGGTIWSDNISGGSSRVTMGPEITYYGREMVVLSYLRSQRCISGAVVS